MQRLQELLYEIAIRAYGLAIRLAAYRNPKAKRFLDGRKGLFDRLKLNVVTNEHYVWIHCASLGEFEQGRPLIEKLRNGLPHARLVLTFFSPSGYEMRKNYEQVDEVYYLPLDTAANAKQFINLLKPKLAIFMKYDFWYNTLKTLHEKGIPTLLVSGRFRRDQLFFKKHGSLARHLLNFFDHFFVQDQDSRDLLTELGFHQSTVIPDTRIDRVYAMMQQAEPLSLVQSFKGDQTLAIGGSTYEEEEAWLSRWYQALEQPPKLIIAPHDPSENRLEGIEKRFKGKTIRYSNLREEQTAHSASILVIDKVGLLGNLYQYADLALIGGGFRKSIHNILEPAAHGVPLLFGLRHEKFPEATALIQQDGAKCVASYEDFAAQANCWLEETNRLKAAKACQAFILSNLGGTDQVYNYIINELDIPAFRKIPNLDHLR